MPVPKWLQRWIRREPDPQAVFAASGYISMLRSFQSWEDTERVKFTWRESRVLKRLKNKKIFNSRERTYLNMLWEKYESHAYHNDY